MVRFTDNMLRTLLSGTERTAAVLQFMENWLAVFKHSIIGKTTFTENISCFVKSIADLIRSMGICTDGDDLAAKFTVTADDIDTWIRFSKPVVITACVQLDSHILCGSVYAGSHPGSPYTGHKNTDGSDLDHNVPHNQYVRTHPSHQKQRYFPEWIQNIPYSRRIPYGLQNKKDNKDRIRAPHGKNR